MSCKSYEELPFETLFQMAEEKYQSLDYQEAEYFYSLAYNKNPHDQILLLCYVNVLKSLQKQKEAKKLLQKSIKDIPSGTYKRYMELAEIYQGVKSIQTYEKGIEQALQCIKNPFKSTAPEAQIKRDIAQAYAGIAQVCLTDLINEKEAEAKCKEAMEKGIQIDKFCIDVKLQIANYQMWRDDFESAKNELIEIYQWIMDNKEEYQSEAINTAGKYLLEVEQYKRSLDLFEKLHEESSSELEVIYMLAFCSFKLNNLHSCEEYLQQYDQVKQSGEIVNDQIEEAVKQMKVELCKKKKEFEETGEDQEEWMDVEDEDDGIEG